MPFPVLQGEGVEYLGHANEAIIAISNYRFHIKFKESVVNVSAGREMIISALVNGVCVRAHMCVCVQGTTPLRRPIAVERRIQCLFWTNMSFFSFPPLQLYKSITALMRQINLQINDLASPVKWL